MEAAAQSLVLDAAILRAPVRRALGSTTAEVETWDIQPVRETYNAVTGGIFRIRGTAADRNQPVRWSLVLKVCRDPGQAVNQDQRAGNYWKREYLAYSSGLLDDLPPGVRAARCYGAEERSASEAWLWLEDLADRYGSHWPLERYGLAGRHAGQLSGAYLGGRPIPNHGWLTTGGAREAVEVFGHYLERLPEFANHPLVRRELPITGTGDRIARLWRERETFLTALGRLPRTLSHLDLFKLNLFTVPGLNGSDETVAVDWAFLGTAAIGEELTPLVCASVTFAAEHVDQVRELGELAFAGYVEGLREAGWNGDQRLARLGYAAGTLRYTMLVNSLVGTIEPSYFTSADGAWGPFSAIVDRHARVLQYTLDLADEARELIADPSFPWPP